MYQQTIAVPSSVYRPENVFNQEFSFPSALIYYLKNQSSSIIVYRKLLTSCKYFCIRKEFLIPFYAAVKNTGLQSKWYATFADKDIYYFDLENINYKIWLSLGFEVFSPESDLASRFVQKIWRCDIAYLDLYNQVMKLDEFEILTPNVDFARLEYTTILHNNGENVPIDCIFALFKKIEDFTFLRIPRSAGVFSPKAITNLSQLIKSSSKLKSIWIENVPNDFNVEPLLSFLTDCPEISFIFEFRGPLPKSQKKLLRNRAQEILDNKASKNPPPLIHYSSQRQKEKMAMDNLYQAYRENQKVEK